MGVLVLLTALLPSMGIRSHYLTQAESPGPVFSKLVPKQSQTSKIQYGIYCTLTLAEVLCLKLAGMPLYDSFIHAFSSAGTGGFSNRNASVGAYGSVAIEMIITVFILLFSINFAIYFLFLSRKFHDILTSDELRFFLGIVAASTVLITLDIRPLYDSIWESLRYAVFQVASIISTTGFGTADYVLWPQTSQMILILLMFCGACAGSTGGGMKCSRVLILLRTVRREIHSIIHPNQVEVVKLDGKVVEEKTIHSISTFVGCYLLVILAATMVISLDGASFSVSFSAALTCVSNVGPGLEIIGPSGNFSAFSALSKLVMSLCMIIGRLEIFPILVLFSRSAWRKN
jgi:trk system potassium uptake protein TrkH